MIGTEQLAQMKPTAFVINVARGGLIDEDALYDALTAGAIAGAGLDVFTTEPPADGTALALLALPNVVVTPHLGASTDEAQEKAGVSVARSVKLALEGELVPDAVNVAGGVIDPFVRPGIAARREARPVLHRPRARARSRASTSRCAASSPPTTSACYRLAALKGIFTNIVSENVSYVNAPLFAEQRGIEIAPHRRGREPAVPQHHDPARHAVRRHGARRSRARSRARSMVPKVVGINGYDDRGADREAPHRDALRRPPGHRRDLRQGARRRGHQHRGLQVAHPDASGRALSVLTVDSPVPDEMLDAMREAVHADLFRQIEITEP